MAILPQNVSELLKDDLSLDRVRDIKEQLIKQNSTTEYQLSKESSKYLGYIEEAFKMLNVSQKSVNFVRESISEVNKLSEENKTSIKRYEIISEATELFETIKTTSAIYEKIVQFGALIDQLNHMLDEELDGDALETDCPSLLQIHYLITMARNFQDHVSAMASVSTDDVQRTASKIFARVSGVTTKFDQLLESLIYDIVEIARGENTSLPMRIFKVLDVEEREDIRIMAIRNIIKKKEIEAKKMSVRKLPNSSSVLSKSLDDAGENEDNYPTDKGIYTELLNGTISTRTLPRGYRTFFHNKLKQSIQDMFVEVRKTYTGDKKFEVLNNLDWVFNELIVVKSILVNYTPSHWNIFQVFYELYYAELNMLINELVEAEPETLIILDILDYDRSFQAHLVAEFGFQKKEAKSIIGAEQRETLFTDYLNLILEKMKEWVANLEKAEFDVFLERSTPPHVDSEGLLFLDGTKTCFQMFTQQVDVASGSNQAKILVGVIQRFVILLLERQQLWTSKIKEEVKKLLKFNEYYDEDPQNIPEEVQVPGGLIEYLVAISNDQMRAADYMIAITKKNSELVSKVWIKDIDRSADKALDSFADLVRESCTGLVHIIFDDLKKPYSEIFSKSWYAGNQGKQISVTLNEYLLEIRPQMSTIVFITFLGLLIDETFFRFVDALNFGHSFKTKGNKFLDSMKRDFEVFYSTFEKFVEPEQRDDLIVKKFTVTKYFMDLSCGPVDTVPEVWTEMIASYPETPIDFLEAVLRCRKDVDSSQRKRMVLQGSELVQGPEFEQTVIDLQARGELSFIGRFRLRASH
ncbi:SNARE-binding exocyst subunit SEC6 KNAG_0L01630 [Huiozyma naganishii CBS 8797]|uniref:Uncharacterized protein n=1 Tax=Huiozyma naganishii (strain ATCC MYA-139 / BCRC 22969 / CBS 8797 / KCTC 17520 / NBRC 10181 / NCYC 3082 / Yp74L-3) TaxID=1071383 RepID=J7RS98_HUIN7|nr:hypothetical protein KNAG_0L01630 [Kazachstania naganishii CBS 8797]CCK72783.1 hypothetical protein KNAG_0L01630 [Kazachstania naganishii CBS 8797]